MSASGTALLKRSSRSELRGGSRERSRTGVARGESGEAVGEFRARDRGPVQPSLTFESAREPAGLKVVEDPVEAASVLDGPADVAVFAFNEGAGRSARILGLGVSTGSDTFYVAKPDAMDVVATTLSGRRISGHDAKETELALRSLGGGRREGAFSTFLAAYLLAPAARDPPLDDLAPHL